MTLLAGAIVPAAALEELAADLAPDLRDFLLCTAKLVAASFVTAALLPLALGVILAMTVFFAVFLTRFVVTEALLADLAASFVVDLPVITFFLFLPLLLAAPVAALLPVRGTDFFARAVLPGLPGLAGPLPGDVPLATAPDFPAGLLPPRDLAGLIALTAPLRLAGFLAALFFMGAFFKAAFLPTVFLAAGFLTGFFLTPGVLALVADLAADLRLGDGRALFRRETPAAELAFAIFPAAFFAPVFRAVFAICHASTICSYSLLCLRPD